MEDDEALEWRGAESNPREVRRALTLDGVTSFVEAFNPVVRTDSFRTSSGRSGSCAFASSLEVRFVG